MPCIRNFRSQTYHDFDRYKLLYKSIGQLYCSLSFVPQLQPKQFSVSGADDKPLIGLGIASLSIAIDDNAFQVQLAVTRNILFPVVLGIDFLQTHGGIMSFPTNQLYLTSLPNPPTSLSMPIASTIHTHHPYTPLSHTIPILA